MLRSTFAVRGLIVTLLCCLAALTGMTYRFVPILEAGTGYAAKNICSGYFLSQFEPQQVINEALVGASPLLAHITFDVDVAMQRVTTSFFGGFTRHAQFYPGTGCTLLFGDDQAIANNVELLDGPATVNRSAWKIANPNPSREAIISDLLNTAFKEQDPDAPKNTKAVVVIHKGRLLAERYAEGVTVDTPLLGWSMTKSIMNLLIGILVKDNQIDITLPAPVPQWRLSDQDLRANITTENLLQMSSGLEFDEEYGLYSDVTRMLSNESNMSAFAAAKPLTASVGGLWSYASGTTIIISDIIRQLTGGTPQAQYEFAQTRLFHPLGITTARLEMDASGSFIGSSYMYASARDWARLGQLCLNQGEWNSQQLLPKDWIQYSTGVAPANPSKHYGAQFWLNQDPANENEMRVFPKLPTDTFAMNGYQGQMVVMVPSEELVVVRLGFTHQNNHGVQDLVAGLIDELNR